MTHTRRNQGVCSFNTTVTLDEAGVIEAVKVSAGCDGNLSGIASLLQGRHAEEVIPLMEGIKCGRKDTSCPAQIAICLREALDKA